MHDIKTFIFFKLVEITNEKLVIVENIEFITFDLNIRDKRMKNIITDVEYISDLGYYMISIELLDRKDCFITTRDKRLIVIDLDDDTIFMIETIQSKTKGNFYVLDFWHFSMRKINAIVFV